MSPNVCVCLTCVCASVCLDSSPGEGHGGGFPVLPCGQSSGCGQQSRSRDGLHFHCALLPSGEQGTGLGVRSLAASLSGCLELGSDQIIPFTFSVCVCVLLGLPSQGRLCDREGEV